jgi:crotonobetainyl-CoA hydratase
MPIHVSESPDGQVLEVVLDRPKANAIDAATSRELGVVFQRFMEHPTQRVAIFTGHGERFFSAGWDLNAANDGESFESDYGVGGFGGFPELPRRSKPIIAAVNGMAIGGGFEIAMAAEMIVAAEHATFSLPEARVGVLPDVGSVRLPRLLPTALANEVLLAGRSLTATELREYGLVNAVATSAGLMDVARELAQRICASAPLSVAAILDIQRDVENLPLHEAMVRMRANAAYKLAIDSQDAQEGPRAFSEKRAPKWTGR